MQSQRNFTVQLYGTRRRRFYRTINNRLRNERKLLSIQFDLVLKIANKCENSVRKATNTSQATFYITQFSLNSKKSTRMAGANGVEEYIF